MLQEYRLLLDWTLDCRPTLAAAASSRQPACVGGMQVLLLLGEGNDAVKAVSALSVTPEESSADGEVSARTIVLSLIHISEPTRPY